MCKTPWSGRGRNLPLLNAVETLQGRDGDKDDNSLLAVANFDLTKTQSQHASSRTLPWTASRPVPEVNCTQARRAFPRTKKDDGICSSIEDEFVLQKKTILLLEIEAMGHSFFFFALPSNIRGKRLS